MSYSIIKSKDGAVIILDNDFYNWTDYVDCDTVNVEVLKDAKLMIPTQQEVEDRYSDRAYSEGDEHLCEICQSTFDERGKCTCDYMNEEMEKEYLDQVEKEEGKEE
jgi:hypothetical protein